jgi:hypothetical protein
LPMRRRCPPFPGEFKRLRGCLLAEYFTHLLNY